MKKLIILLVIGQVVAFAQQPKPYLSNLSATKNSPLYTTYAAAMERSEFKLDEGYHFTFYDSTHGADFVTDMAGDWCLGFKMGSRYVYELKDMFKEPTISASYPDMVKYYYFPFENIRVEVAFVVHSSRAALQDVTVRNAGTKEVALELLPFLRDNYRSYNNVAFHKDDNAITFTHEELPDGWVLEHNVPYIDKIQNVILFSSAPDRMMSFRSYQWGNVDIPQRIELAKQPVCVAWGRATHQNNERCRHRLPMVKLMAMLNQDKSRMITETAPRWGGTDQNISGNGFFGIELGNFDGLKDGDDFTLMYTCDATGQSALWNGTYSRADTTKNVQHDVSLTASSGPREPADLRKDIWGSGTEIRLYWKKVSEAVAYNVYRRNYRESGEYKLIGANVQQTFFTDRNISDDRVYGYVVTALDSQGRMSMHSDEINNVAGSDFLTDVRYPGQNVSDVKDLARVVSAQKKVTLAPGASAHFRVVRAVAPANDDRKKLIEGAEPLLTEDIDKYLREDELLFSRIPLLRSDDPDKEMMYWSGYSLMRQVMLPPEGKCHFNYYVFSREPQWGWGHGGQVFHESLTMLAYANMDPMSAMNSQRVYRERQRGDGYINYRTGAYLDESIPYENQLTTSAPWYAWQNWEIFKITKDREFLDEMYKSSKAFYNYYVKNRDSDGDGLCEWGGEAVLESVRDGLVAVWDEVGWPSNFEALDLNTMLVQEEKTLSAMAAELGMKGEAQEWSKMAAVRTKKINDTMWDDSTGFYYNIDKKTHTFTHKKTNDLKREEIIGFLPLWAGIASEQQAKELVRKLTDPKKFWRKFGVPTLAADDPYYNPKGYWNGPVWIQWDYLIERGLLAYGYKNEAREMVDNVAANMIAQLKKDHNFWEFYSPDDQWAGYHKTYIWAGIITRMMMDAK